MRKIFLTVLFLFFFAANAQKELMRTSYYVDLNSNPKSYITVGYKSGDIEIQGDTIEAIKHLVQFIEQVQKENEDYFICIDFSVKWHNKVSDYFKKGNEYQNYLKQLKKKNGYKVKK